MARDFDLMEGLGIYEVTEEDFALCEFVCTSKLMYRRFCVKVWTICVLKTDKQENQH